MLLLLMAACPAPKPPASDSAAPEDTGDVAATSVSGELGGDAFPAGLTAFWYSPPSAPRAWLAGPGLEVSEAVQDTPEGLDNTVAVTLVLTDQPDACAAFAGWWAAAGALLEDVAARDAEALAALSEAERAWLAEESWMLAVGVSTDSADTLAGSYDLGGGAVADAFHHRGWTDWAAAAAGEEPVRVDWFIGEDGALELGADGEDLAGEGTIGFDEGELTFHFSAAPCPAASEAAALLDR